MGTLSSSPMSCQFPPHSHVHTENDFEIQASRVNTCSRRYLNRNTGYRGIVMMRSDPKFSDLFVNNLGSRQSPPTDFNRVNSRDAFLLQRPPSDSYADIIHSTFVRDGPAVQLRIEPSSASDEWLSHVPIVMCVVWEFAMATLCIVMIVRHVS